MKIHRSSIPHFMAGQAVTCRLPHIAPLFAAALFITLSWAAPAQAEAKKAKPAKVAVDTVEYRSGDLALQGLWVTPKKKDASSLTLLMFPDWMGITPQAGVYAEELAQWGYRVFVADPYGKGAQPADTKEAGQKAGALRGDLPELRKRGAAALAELRKRAGDGKVVALGYCFGGGATLELARSGAALDGAVSIHGNLNTADPKDAKAIRAKVLVLHGGDDPHVPMEQVSAFVKEMQDAQVDWQLFQYGGAVHAFTNPKAGDDPSRGVAYDPVARERAYAALKDFLAEIGR